LPYELVVDGVVRDLGDQAHLLSPQDLESSALVPELARLGVSSLKIEGRLKGPAYVASATRLYRHAVDGDVDENTLRAHRQDALQTYSRGSDHGFLGGTDHQRLVDGNTCDHRGLTVGRVLGVVERELHMPSGDGPVRRARRHAFVELVVEVDLARGDGIVVEGGYGGVGEVGGRVWDLVHNDASCASVPAGAHAFVWLGPDVDLRDVVIGRRMFKNDDPALEKRILADVERAPSREPLDVTVRGTAGGPLVVRGVTAHGRHAEVHSDVLLERAELRPLNVDVLRDKLGRLGDTSYLLRNLTLELDGDVTLPLSQLNHVRRALCEALEKTTHISRAVTTTTAAQLLNDATVAHDAPPAGLFVLCRTLPQARAAIAAGADGVYLDFLALTGTGNAVRELRAEGARFVGLAPPRIRKPGEEKIESFLWKLDPDAMLVRSLGAYAQLSNVDTRALLIGDFSLNVSNRLTASLLLQRLHAFVPSLDLDEKQLLALLSTSVGPYAELVLHHPMPLFHMEHCVFAALMSDGADYRTCGRPCESHTIGLRDRVGMDHPVEADVGCRNTVFHARAQSAASLVRAVTTSGARRFRIELVREGAAEVTSIVHAYRRLLDGATTPREVLHELHAEGGFGVVKGSLRVLA
jgi:putative protease